MTREGVPGLGAQGGRGAVHAARVEEHAGDRVRHVPHEGRPVARVLPLRPPGELHRPGVAEGMGAVPRWISTSQEAEDPGGSSASWDVEIARFEIAHCPHPSC